MEFPDLVLKSGGTKIFQGNGETVKSLVVKFEAK
jgi:hypothetical protein